MNLDEARAWSIERLKFEVEVLEKKQYDKLDRELRDIAEDYYNETPQTNPGAFDRDGNRTADGAPWVLSSYPAQLERMQEQIDALRDIIRNKL